MDALAMWIGYAVMSASGLAAAAGLLIGAVMLFNRASWALLSVWGGVKTFKQFVAWYHRQPENQKKA